MKDTKFYKYSTFLTSLIKNLEVTNSVNKLIDIDKSLDEIIDVFKKAHSSSNKVMFIGNGGSAGMCSHLATDLNKNGKIRSTAFNDGATLTCLGNDYGYEYVFQKQLEFHAQPGDVLVAISSSGNSANIIKAVNYARDIKNCKIITFSGFSRENGLKKLGDYNFYIPNKDYGFVEVGHLMLFHTIIDTITGWKDTSPF